MFLSSKRVLTGRDKYTMVGSMELGNDKKPYPEAWLLRRCDVLKLLQVSDSTFRREIQAGRFPKPIEVGRVRRWRLSWVIEYLNGKENETRRETV